MFNTLLYLAIIEIGVKSCAALNTDSLTTPASKLRYLLSQSIKSNHAIAVPGVHDSLCARIFAQNKSPVLFVSGFGVSATYLGQPDAGILTLSEMEEVTRNIVRATSQNCDDIIPVIVDGDTGYGGAPNIRRTIRNLASAGAAAITIEDQVFPKKCTYAAGENVKVITRSEACDRIRTAIAAREQARVIDGNDVLIIARTDCRAALGFDEVVKRCEAFQELGADIVYAENLQSREEYIKLRKTLDENTPMMLAQLQLATISKSEKQIDSNKQTLYSMRDVRDMGYNLALFGVTALQASVCTLQSLAQGFQQNKVFYDVDNESEKDSSVTLSPFSTVKEVVGFTDLDQFERKYSCL